MNIIKHDESKDYIKIKYEYLQDKTLSLKAIGLLCKLVSFPKDEQVSIKKLVNGTKDGERSVLTALNELKSRGYVIIHKKYPDETPSGKIEYYYEIYN